MSKIELTSPCHFGTESVLKYEITKLGYDVTQVIDGRVSFACPDMMGIIRANLHLRSGERVMIKVAEFQATSFEELFQGAKQADWERYIPKEGVFDVVKATSTKSVLFSPRDIQSIVKKAIVERMRQVYKIDWLPESAEQYPVRVFILKDMVSIYIDSSGDPLHKRGYRPLSSIAPIRETLAASLIDLSYWRQKGPLVDPFCGSGTIPIEAAMIAKRMAPGINRKFMSEKWSHLLPQNLWALGVEEALDMIIENPDVDIQGYDIDESVLKIARENAKNAEVDHLIHFQKRDVKDLRHSKKFGTIITNPPYGERMEEIENIGQLYGTFGKAFRQLEDWSLTVITSYEEFERVFGKKADKNRKIYNGMLKTYVYQYLAKKPTK